MSGTSCDGVDGAVVEITGRGLNMRVRLIGHVHQRYPRALRDRLMAAMAPAQTNTQDLCALHAEVGEAFGRTARRAVRELLGARAGVIDRGMVSHSSDLCGTWDECFSEDAASVARCAMTIRNKCFAHWDPKIAKAFLRHRQERDKDVAFIESDAEGKFLRTRYPWAQAAVARLIVGDTEDVDAMRSVIKPLLRFGPRLANLVTELVVCLIAKLGLRFEQVKAE